MTKHKAKSKKGRVIIRNLSFKATEEILRNNFSKFGEISEIIIPKKPDGKMCGFGFVQFEKTASAIMAINALNAKEILGRPVAIDFAIPKDKFRELKTESSYTEQNKTHNLNENNISTESKDDRNEDNDEEGDPCNKNRQSKSHKDSRINSSDENLSAKNINQSRSSSDSDSDEDLSDKNINQSRTRSDSDDDDDLSDENINQSRSSSDSDDSDSDEEDYINKKRKLSTLSNDSDGEVPSDKNKKAKLSRPSDVSEGRTLFIRNLSFDTTAEELKEIMSKYGNIKYCLLCKDPLTEYPKGTGFVQFVKKEDADKCLEDCNSKDKKIILGGRMLNVVLAITHNDIEKQKEARKKKGKDNRNLRLEKEGLIRPGSDAAENVSQADLTKRLQLEKYKRKLLKNLNYFISSVRLCVHNIPLHFDDKKLRKIFLKAAGPGAVVTEARIMRNFKKLDEKGVGLSKGFAFITFTKHEHALQALRKLNNNPDVFSPHKRPIVEFSVENRSILNAKKQQIERQNKRPFLPKKTYNNPSTSNFKIHGKKQKLLGNGEKKFSESFKSNKTGNQQYSTKKLKRPKKSFKGNIKTREKKRLVKKRKKLKGNAS